MTAADVVPLSDDDPTGAGISAMGFPLALGGILGGVVISLLVAGVTGPLLGILGGHFLLGALVIGVGMLATASTIVGLNALLGTPGIAVGVLTMLVGNPGGSVGRYCDDLPVGAGARWSRSARVSSRAFSGAAARIRSVA